MQYAMHKKKEDIIDTQTLAVLLVKTFRGEARSPVFRGTSKLLNQNADSDHMHKEGKAREEWQQKKKVSAHKVKSLAHKNLMMMMSLGHT